MDAFRCLRIAGSINLIALGSANLNAQQLSCATYSAPLPATDRAWCGIDETPLMIVDSAGQRVRFPDVLRARIVSGEVVAEATVTPDGRFDMLTTHVRQSPHVLFTNAVRAFMPQVKFRPGSVAGGPVRTRGVFRFAFASPGVDSGPVARDAWPPRPTADGYEFSNGWRRITYAPPPTTDSVHVFGLIEAIVRFDWKEGDKRARCVHWPAAGSQDPPHALFAYLERARTRVFAPSSCPPTYASMYTLVDSLGRPKQLRPPGALDPQIVVISDWRPWTRNAYVFTLAIHEGMSGKQARCQGVYESFWQVNCSESWRSWVH